MIEYYTYWIVFNGYYDEYNPVLYGSLNKMREDNVGTMHLFDKNLVTILSAVEYVMHMPRLELDLYDLDEGTIDAAYDESHNIFPIPDSLFINVFGNMQKVSPTLIIYADNCDKRVESISSFMQPTLGCYKVSQLTEKLLKEHWIRLGNRLKPDGYKKISNINDQYLLKDEYIKALPLFFLARQYKNINEMLQHIYNTSNIEKTCIEVQWKQNTKQSTYMEMYKRGICDIEIAEKVYNDIYIKQAEKLILMLWLHFQEFQNSR